MKRVTVGGCRLHSRGMHLGHLNGCFLPRSPMHPTGSSYVFVVGDVACTRPWDADERAQFVRQVYACETYVHPIRIAFESDLRRVLGPLIYEISRLMTLPQLFQVHPG